jgi:hypothetical protein
LSYPPVYGFRNMNTENTQQARGKLEKLTVEQQSYIVWLAKRSTQENILEALKEHGIEVSPATLSRFLKKRRAEEAVEEGKEIAGSVEALAEQGRAGRLREGTLQVMRQQVFEKAAGGLGGEEAQALYGALVAEEARVKELELEARKVAALEQQVKLQERRIEVEAMKARALLGRVKGEILESKKGVALLGEGEPPKGGTPYVEEERAKLELSDPNQRWVELVRVVLGILNRGGDPGPRIFEARELLADEARKFGNGEL